MDKQDKEAFQQYIKQQPIGDREDEHENTWQAALNYERERLRENTHVEYECDDHNYLGAKPCPYCEKDLEGWL